MERIHPELDVTERTRQAGQTDGRTDGRTETNIPPTTSLFGGYNYSLSRLSLGIHYERLFSRGCDARFNLKS